MKFRVLTLSLVSPLLFASAHAETPPPSSPAEQRAESGPLSSTGKLTVDEVHRSILTHHPLISAARERVNRAEGNQLSARGYFDPTLKAQGKVTTLGYYELRTFDSELRQRTGLWGLELFGGYRIGSRVDSTGTFPNYSSDQTLPGGEVRGGLEVPVFRDGPIDAGRARIQSAAASTDAAQFGEQRTTLETALAGARAYFRWVAAGQKWQLALDTLALAETRATQMAARAETGLTSDFDRIDNERMVFERKERSIAARRELEAASFELSLFLRHSDGQPKVPSEDALPSFSREAAEEALVLAENATRQRLAQCHPALAQARSELRGLDVELRQAENQVAPDLRLSAQVSQDIGDSTNLPALAGPVLEAGLKFSMPLLLSNDRGQAKARLASVGEKRNELRFAEERIGALVKDLNSRLVASQQRRSQNQKLSAAARILVDGERERVESGISNLLFLNLRELAALDADSRLVDAQILEREVLFEVALLQAIRCN